MSVDEIKEIEKVLEDSRQGLSNQARRLLHGRGGCFSGLEFLSIDYLPPVVLVTLYQKRERFWQSKLSQRILDLNLTAIEAVAIQDREASGEEYFYTQGEIPIKHIVQEQGLQYHIDCTKRKNMGLFLDFREGRDWLKQNSENKSVLNLFAFTCSLSVAAIAGGARKVFNVDMSKGVLNRGRENHRINNHDSRKVSYLSGNVFKSQSRIKKYGPWDIMILDPPPRQKESFSYERDYIKLIKKCEDWSSDAAMVLATMNDGMRDHQFLPKLFAEHAPNWQCIQKGSSGVDFPEEEGKGLQWLVYQKNKD